MLLNLHVKNLALIEESEVTFGSGLNILSGETGAGKSIIIGSVNLALGGKVSRSMLRENAEFALVELIFSIENEAQAEVLRALDIFPENGEIIMSRKIYASGRSVSRINSETVSASVMRKVASLLIDIHGQHEHESLLAKRNHMKYLDDFAKRVLAERKKLLAEVYDEYTVCRKKLEEASLDAKQQARELSFLQYEIDEIDQADLKPGEDEVLEADFKKMSHGRKITEAIAECQELCSEGNENAADLIGRSVRALHMVAQFDASMEALSGQLEEVENLFSDFNRELSGYASELNFSEEAFQQIEDRLNQINHLKAKYGKTIERILEARQEKEEKLDQLQHYEEYRQQLQENLSQAEAKLNQLCQEVTEIRKSYAKDLTAQTTAALQDLNFLDVRFEMEFSRLDHFTANGWDETRFMISTNPGEPLKPLDAVASGGELSRIMLALKTVLAEHDEIETLIFDEIDSGISGRTAQMVAEKIKMTGKNHQIICITHLPQIAAMADHHFLIEKTSSADSTISNIRPLEREESIQELARMLGGVKITDTVLQNEIPGTVCVSDGQSLNITEGLPVTSQIRSTDGIAVSAGMMTGGRYEVECKLFGLIPVKEVTVHIVEEMEVIPCGIPFGIYIEMEGILVVELCDLEQNGISVESPAEHILKPGDYITAVNGAQVTAKEDLQRAVAESGGSVLQLTVVRGGEAFQCSVTPICTDSKIFQIGVWVRDDLAGIGTLTYIDGEGTFGALGHGITDTDVEHLISVLDGTVYQANILSVIRGEQGKPGELVGQIHYNQANRLGQITKNTKNGIFGQIENLPDSLADATSMEIGFKQEIENGPAQILATIDDQPELFDIEIMDVDLNPRESNKGIRFQVTDANLIRKTGGIIQGLSGAPILQNGKVIGAVTHVLVNDPCKGYGIFIETMIEQ